MEQFKYKKLAVHVPVLVAGLAVIVFRMPSFTQSPMAFTSMCFVRLYRLFHGNKPKIHQTVLYEDLYEKPFTSIGRVTLSDP